MNRREFLGKVVAPAGVLLTIGGAGWISRWGFDSLSPREADRQRKEQLFAEWGEDINRIKQGLQVAFKPDVLAALRLSRGDSEGDSGVPEPIFNTFRDGRLIMAHIQDPGSEEADIIRQNAYASAEDSEPVSVNYYFGVHIGRINDETAAIHEIIPSNADYAVVMGLDFINGDMRLKLSTPTDAGSFTLEQLQEVREAFFRLPELDWITVPTYPGSFPSGFSGYDEAEVLRAQAYLGNQLRGADFTFMGQPPQG